MQRVREYVNEYRECLVNNNKSYLNFYTFLAIKIHKDEASEKYRKRLLTKQSLDTLFKESI